MSLNNLHSETIQKEFGNNYFNFGVWAQKMDENYEIIKILNYLNPKTIIMPSNTQDFGKATAIVIITAFMDNLFFIVMIPIVFLFVIL